MGLLFHNSSECNTAAIQAIRDRPGTAIEQREDALNGLGEGYPYILGTVKSRMC